MIRDFELNFYDMVTVGERGQVVIPSSARGALGIKPGDKLMVMKGLIGSSLVFMKMKSMNALLEKAMKAAGKIKGSSGKRRTI